MTDGRCLLCGDTYTNKGMTQHLRGCRSEVLTAGDRMTMQLRIGATRRSDYWLHVDTDATTTLATLDGFLRGLWLECCGHMSAFTIDDTRFVTPYADEQPAGSRDQRSMDVPLTAVVHGGQEFTYEYDFGTTTELSLRVTELGPYESAHEPIDDDLGYDHDAVQLLARNRPPDIECEDCGASATVVCQRCLHDIDASAWFCEECGDGHECERPMFMPVVNSPRVGVCGYRG